MGGEQLRLCWGLRLSGQLCASKALKEVLGVGWAASRTAPDRFVKKSEPIRLKATKRNVRVGMGWW